METEKEMEIERERTRKMKRRRKRKKRGEGVGKEGKAKCDYYRYLYSMRVVCDFTVIQIRVLLMDPDRHVAERINTQTNFKSFSHTKFLGTKCLCAVFFC